ncbi:MAG: hypothetical protein M1831_003131 [Alyxoria varia]|nr:MAG: hypothetical protein M1831_003131 [Alyxoria varia]
MDFVRARHKKEERDLQSQISQKKKTASKKSRKIVNDECARLEEELKARHARELENGKGLDPAREEVHEGGVSEDDVLLASIAGDSPGPSIEKLSVNGYIAQSDQAEIGSDRRRKPNRQKARLARRTAEQEEAAAKAAQEASNLPDLKQRERTKMLEEIKKRELIECPVAANGHCLYLAVADQLRDLRIDVLPVEVVANEDTNNKQEDYRKVRHAAADFISKHPDDFEPFLEEPLSDYLRKIRDTGEWGGQLELLALAKTYNIDINVLQADGRPEKVESGGQTKPPEAWLAYYRHGFGLGEHYNSLRKAPKC